MKKIHISLTILIIVIISSSIFVFRSCHKTKTQIPTIKNIIYVDKTPTEDFSIYNTNTVDKNNIPYKYQYKTVNQEKLKSWLSAKNSVLANDYYLDLIIQTSKSYNLHPCILISIIGQEQNFVPKSSPYSGQIINNPYNVFGSWKKYNTNIKDSTDIACKTIIKISKDRPHTATFFVWLNKKDGNGGGYAEDVNWHKGVESFFEILSEVAK